MTHNVSKTENSIADVSYVSFCSTLSEVEQRLMWQALIKGSPRNPKNATSLAKKNMYVSKCSHNQTHVCQKYSNCTTKSLKLEQ